MITRADRNTQVTAHTLEHRDGPTTVTPQELADYWGVHVQTIYRDIRKGALRAFRLPGGDIRIRVEDARRYGRPVV
jgi:excisionase family DNA binding protein